MKTIAQDNFDCKWLQDSLANVLEGLLLRPCDAEQIVDLDTFSRTAILELGDEAPASVLRHRPAKLVAHGDMASCPKCEN